MDWKARIRSAFAPDVPDDDVVEELAQHAAATYASARAEGCDSAQAERRAADQIAAWTANPALLRRRPKRLAAVLPPTASRSPLGAVAQDARYGWRLLVRQPAFAAVAIATIALGVAATTVIGSLAYGVLLKPLPWSDAPRLVRLYENRQGSTRRFKPMMSNAVYTEWAASHNTLDGLGAWSSEQVTISERGSSERIKLGVVTPGLFELLGARPALGRTLAAGEEQPGKPPVLLLSHGFWQQRFGGRSDVVGQSLSLEGKTYTIVGVMPPAFAFPDRETRAWAPFYVPPVVQRGTTGFSISMFQAVGRLKLGTTPEQAAAEGTARGRAAPEHGVVAMAVFGSTGPAEVSAVPMLQALTSEVRPAILVLLAAVALLLATATANVASLQLARATVRRRELAIRAALGAGRGRLVRQILIENLLVGLLGGVAGVLLAALMHRGLPALLPADFPRVDDMSFDFRIQAFAGLVSIVAGLGCGLLPALHVARRELVPALVEDSLAPVGAGLRSPAARARAVVMAAQVAIACVLLVGALLLTRSFSGMLHADIGYEARNALSARVVLPDVRYTPERRAQAMQLILERLQATPGVSRAAFTTAMPFAGGLSLSSFPLKKRDGASVQIQTGARWVSAGYFAALGQRVLEGREFSPQDTGGAAAVVIVNREFSRKYLDGRALGWILPGRPSDRTIVGVVDDAVRQSVTDAPQPEVYYAAAQRPMDFTELFLVVRAAADPRPLVAALRTIVRDAAPDAPVESVMTVEDRFAATLSAPRLYAVLLGTFAAFALAIAGVGLFGVLSYTVAQRAREIGVRSALGAQVRDIVRLVVGQSMAMAGAGVLVGLTVSFWVARTLQKFLYGVTPHDAISFAAVALVLLAVAAVASIVPARRAARVDPVKVLRA